MVKRTKGGKMKLSKTLIGDMQDFSRHSFAEYLLYKMFNGNEE